MPYMLCNSLGLNNRVAGIQEYTIYLISELLEQGSQCLRADGMRGSRLVLEAQFPTTCSMP